MTLVTTLLTGNNNYLSWSHCMKIALGAQVKLGFVNGKCEMPSEESPNFEQWNRVDCMVTSWILNSVSKEIIEAFLYTNFAIELWRELEERFGLNESFDHIRNQILVMDHLPTINKAYLMVLRVEKQREVHITFTENIQNTAMFAKAQNYKKKTVGKKGYKRKDMMKKSKRHCEFSNNDGHTKETCFKLHGYPEWYNEFKDQKGKSLPKNYANMIETLLEVEGEQVSKGTKWNNALSELIQQELTRFMKGRAPTDGSAINYAHFADFAGIVLKHALSSIDLLDSRSWIIDREASSHMCVDLEMLDIYVLIQ
ncbi:hypothetical protein Pint_17980 [Pistacia integerrima]|uniref:Uncharacterized protein n=1 Tax=Pistacia integerrima TaxID=434235 RepID=A0ACC0Z1W6_9ROSI|nr:hypothetical protein Pint_17980 [Pistacia integerrima]